MKRAVYRGRPAAVLRPAPAAAPGPSLAQQALARGVSHYQAGRLVEAAAIYRQVLAAEPTNAGALHLLGVLANTVGQHVAAIELISQSIQIDPNVASSQSNLG